MAAACIGLLIAITVVSVESWQLAHHGIRTTALVQFVQHDDRSTTYELDFTLRDGTPFSAWTNDVRSGTQSGESIQIAYLPTRPATVEDVRVLGLRWIYPVIFTPIIVFFLWLDWTIWRMNPESFRRAAARSRYRR